MNHPTRDRSRGGDGGLLNQPEDKQHRYCQIKGAQPLQICQKAQAWSQSSLPRPTTAPCQQGVCVKSCYFTLLEWIFWFVSTDVWFTSQSGLEASDLDSFQVNPNWNMMQKHCRNTPNVLQTLMDQTVYGRWLKLAWSKCLEISA